MSKAKASFNPGNELLIQRYAGGVRLLRPGTPHPHPAVKASVYELLNMPMNFYFMDGDSMLQKLNDQTAASCGYLSKFDAVGRSIREISKKETALSILQNDREIVRTRKLKISDETYTRLDDSELTAISIKFPLFAEHNRVIGILGCSILMNQKGSASLTDSLSLLMQTGLLGPSLDKPDNLLPGLQCGEIYLDQRDRDILFLLTRGKTAKESAKILNLSHRTIEHRLEKIKAKFNAASKSELIDKVLNFFA